VRQHSAIFVWEVVRSRLILIWDNLAGHLSSSMVVWLFAHGVMPLYTPLSGSWLNMAESVQRILCSRTLNGQHGKREKAREGARG